MNHARRANPEAALIDSQENSRQRERARRRRRRVGMLGRAGVFALLLGLAWLLAHRLGYGLGELIGLTLLGLLVALPYWWRRAAGWIRPWLELVVVVVVVLAFLAGLGVLVLSQLPEVPEPSDRTTWIRVGIKDTRRNPPAYRWFVRVNHSWWSSAGKRKPPEFESFGENAIEAHTRVCDRPSPCSRVVGPKQNSCSMTLLESGGYRPFLTVSYRLSDKGCELRRGG